MPGIEYKQVIIRGHLCSQFIQCFNAWWVLWASRDVSWDYGRFLVQLGPPLILYLQATTLVTSTPQSVENWRAHFYAVRRRFFRHRDYTLARRYRQ